MRVPALGMTVAGLALALATEAPAGSGPRPKSGHTCPNCQLQKAIRESGNRPVVVNNASAIQLTGTLQTDIRRYDLMNQVNARGTFITSRTCIPHLKQSSNPHVLMLSPPLDMSPRWFAGHVAYTMAKFGMSMCVLGMAEEFKDDGIAFNALWPRTPMARKMMLPPVESRPDPLPFHMGQLGVAVSELKPMGVCEFDGRRVESVSESGVVAAGSRVKVMGADNRRPLVRVV